jgi:hypothetical protein
MLIPLGILGASGGIPIPDFDLIQTAIVSGTTTGTISFNSPSSTYRHLQLRCTYKPYNDNNQRNLQVRFNSVSIANYTWHRLTGNGSAVSSLAGVDRTSIEMLALAPPASNSDNFGASVIDILDFATAGKKPVLRALSGQTFGPRVALDSGFLNDTVAISSIQLTLSGNINFLAGSRFSLYGIKG